MNRLDQIFGDCDSPIGALPESDTQTLTDEIRRSMGVHGLHDMKSLRLDVETACERIHWELTATERSSIAEETLNQCIADCC